MITISIETARLLLQLAVNAGSPEAAVKIQLGQAQQELEAAIKAAEPPPAPIPPPNRAARRAAAKVKPAAKIKQEAPSATQEPRSTEPKTPSTKPGRAGRTSPPTTRENGRLVGAPSA